jgi:hypothetical protein
VSKNINSTAHVPRHRLLKFEVTLLVKRVIYLLNELINESCI